VLSENLKRDDLLKLIDLLLISICHDLERPEETEKSTSHDHAPYFKDAAPIRRAANG
jgi:hypothetical protein